MKISRNYYGPKKITCIFSSSELIHPFLTAKFRPLISINIIIFQPGHSTGLLLSYSCRLCAWKPSPIHAIMLYIKSHKIQKRDKALNLFVPLPWKRAHGPPFFCVFFDLVWHKLQEKPWFVELLWAKKKKFCQRRQPP